MTQLPYDIEGYLKGTLDFGGKSFQSVVDDLWGSEQKVLNKYWGPKGSKVEELFGKFSFLRFNNFPYKIHVEHRKLLFVLCVGFLRRCGVEITDCGDVRPIENGEVEAILSDSKTYVSDVKYKAFVLVRIGILILFTIGAYRIAIAVANISLQMHMNPRNWLNRNERWFEEETRLQMLLRGLIGSTYNDSEVRYFEEDPLFSGLIDPTQHGLCCKHGILLETGIVSNCIFALSSDPQHSTRVCRMQQDFLETE